MHLYYALACTVLAVHALFIVWVIFGAALTRGRPLLRWLHIGSLIWGVWIEAGPWPCPLTWAENWLELRAGVGSYQGAFLLHYLDKFVYPDISAVWLTEAAVLVALMNGVIYARRLRQRKANRCRRNTPSSSRPLVIDSSAHFHVRPRAKQSER